MVIVLNKFLNVDIILLTVFLVSTLTATENCHSANLCLSA
jgi:hypothetical protein